MVAGIVLIGVAGASGWTPLADPLGGVMGGVMDGLAGRDRDEVALPAPDRPRDPAGAGAGPAPSATPAPAPGPATAGGLACRPNGCARWTASVPATTASVVVGTTLIQLGDTVTAIDAATGQARWSRALTTLFAEPPPGRVRSFALGGHLLLSERGRLVLLDVADGTPRWSVDLGDRWVNRAGQHEDVLVVTATTRLRGRSQPLPTTAVGLDVADGTVRWERQVRAALAQVPARATQLPLVSGGDQGRLVATTGLALPDGVLPVDLGLDRVGALGVLAGDLRWERDGEQGQVVAGRVVVRAAGGRATAVDPATGRTLAELGGDIVEVVGIGRSLAAVAATGTTTLFGPDGRPIEEREGPPLGWSATPTGAFAVWSDDGWALLVRYDPDGTPARSRRLPGRIGNWGGELTVGSERDSDLVRVVGTDGRTTVAVRTDGPTEPPPNPSIAPQGTRIGLIGRTMVLQDDGGLTVQGLGGSVRITDGRDVLTVTPDGTVVIRGTDGLLAIAPGRLGPVTVPEGAGVR